MSEKTVSAKIHPGPTALRIFFFIVGIVATVAYRITPFIAPNHVKIAWYIGTAGFVIFFSHRAHIEWKRAKLVEEYRLDEAVEESSLTGDQKTAIAYLVKTSLTSKARYNSAFIVGISAIAFLGALITDLHLI